VFKKAMRIIQYVDMNISENTDQHLIVMNRRGGKFILVNEKGRELESFPVIYGAQMIVKDGVKVAAGDMLAAWDPFTTPILSEVDGVVKFGDIVPGKTMQEIGNKFSCSRENIRQILKKMNVQSRPSGIAIDDVRIYDLVLSAQQIYEIYVKSLPQIKITNTTTNESIKKEIIDLHQFFEDWFTGKVAYDISRFDKVMAADFELISPSGSLIQRGNLVE